MHDTSEHLIHSHQQCHSNSPFVSYHICTAFTDRFGQSLFRSVTALTTGNCISPVTGAGRIYVAGLTFCFLIFTSSYTATLTAIFSLESAPVPSVNRLEDFASLGKICCVRNTSNMLNFAQVYYPQMAIYVSGNSETDLANDIKSGKCDGAFTTTVHLRYFLQYIPASCDLRMYGPDLSE